MITILDMSCICLLVAMAYSELLYLWIRIALISEVPNFDKGSIDDSASLMNKKDENTRSYAGFFGE